MKPSTSALMNSSSHSVIEMMRQRPSKGDFGFGLAFPILLLRFFLSRARLLSGDVGDESLAIRFLLNLSLQSPGVHHEAVDLDHPGHRAFLDQPAQHPVEVELANLE